MSPAERHGALRCAHALPRRIQCCIPPASRALADPVICADAWALAPVAAAIEKKAAIMAGSATVAATMLVVVHPRPGLESSPSRSPRPRLKWRRAAKRAGVVLFAGGGVLLR